MAEGVAVLFVLFAFMIFLLHCGLLVYGILPLIIVPEHREGIQQIAVA